MEGYAARARAMRAGGAEDQGWGGYEAGGEEEEGYGSSLGNEEEDYGAYGASPARTAGRKAGRAQGEGYGSRRTRGGWYGDSEGHSKASRRGWEEGGHEDSGWYGDPQGHSQASRRGWERDDHAPSGWFGDSKGHAEASRRGWQSGHGSVKRGRGSRSTAYEEDGQSRRGGQQDSW